VHATYARLESGQPITKGWHTAGDQLITIDTLAAVAVRCQIVYCPIEAVKLTQKGLKYAAFYIFLGFAL
jgi:hypothetical protein